jgi:hypothetical protein
MATRTTAARSGCLTASPSMYPMTREPAPGAAKQASARRAWSHQPPLKGRPPCPVLLAARVSAKGPAVRASRDRAPGVHPARADEPQAGMGDLANALETRFGSGVLLPASVLARVHHASAHDHADVPDPRRHWCGGAHRRGVPGGVMKTIAAVVRSTSWRSVSLRVAVQYVRPVRTREAP